MQNMALLSPSNCTLKTLNSSRQAIAKSIITNKQNLTPKRLNFRQEFVNRLKQIRHDKIDKLRQICEEHHDLDYKSLIDLKKLLRPDKETSKLLQNDDVMDLLQQVENEILEKQIEQQYYNEVENETDQIINNLMDHCKICDVLLNEGTVCRNCVKEFNSGF